MSAPDATPPVPSRREVERARLDGERHELLHHVARALDAPMTVLGVVWLVLVVVDLTRGLPPALGALDTAI